MLSFKPTFSLSYFTFIKRLFSSSSLSVIRVVSSAYLRLLIFLLAILIPACASSSPAFLTMYSAYKLNKHGDNIQLSKAHLTSHSRVSGSRSVITPGRVWFSPQTKCWAGRLGTRFCHHSCHLCSGPRSCWRQSQCLIFEAEELGALPFNPVTMLGLHTLLSESESQSVSRSILTDSLQPH